MLTITNRQMAMFRAHHQADFRQRAMAEIARQFPFDMEVLGPAQLAIAIGLACERADTHGITLEDDLTDYIRMAFLFGSFFDEDPLLPWISQILKDPKFPTNHKMLNIKAHARAWLTRTTGADGGAYRAALRRARRIRLHDILVVRSADAEHDLRIFLDALFPAQARAMPASHLQALMTCAARTARAHGLAERGGVLLVAGLAFLLGVGFDRDPLHPWAAGPLAADVSQDIKAERLLAAAHAHLARYSPRVLRRQGEAP